MAFSLIHFTHGKKLDPAVREVLGKLHDTYGERLHFLSLDDKWIHFTVQGKTNEKLLRELDDLRETLFGNLLNFQVLCPSDPSSRGVYLHYLKTPALRIEYKSGVNYC